MLHKFHTMTRFFYALCWLILISFPAIGQIEFQLPPREILELADIQAPAQNIISPNNKFLVQLDRPLYKTLEELAEPELKLAGLRINPENFSQSRGAFFTSIKLFTLPDAKEKQVTGLPNPLRMQYISFSPAENHLAFVIPREKDLELWLLDLATGKARYTGVHQLNATMGMPYTWDAEGKSLLARQKGNKGPWVEKRELPKGPATQDATGTKAPARTYQDLLRNQQDEAKFDYYAKAEIWRVFTEGTANPVLVLPEAIYKRIHPSPDGQMLLTETLEKPYSYTLPFGFFPSNFDVSDRNGKKISTFYKRPLQDKTPTDFDAVEAGRRSIMWRNDEAATLLWAEAQDGGDPKIQVENRDRLFQSKAPFTDARPICFLKYRFAGIQFGRSDIAVVEDYWWKTRQTRRLIVNPSQDNPLPRLLFERSSEDEYGNPGEFVTEENAWHRQILKFSKDGKKLYLEGEGCSPEGNRPFLDEFSLANQKMQRLWRADGKSTYESIVRILDLEKKQIMTSIQSSKVMPNLFIRDFGKSGSLRQITFRPNPYAALAQVQKKQIFYKRNDGVQLSATLYLPPGYDPVKSGRLPMLMEAYPTEFKDDKAAGQVKESPHQFIAVNWASPVYWVLRGYAVLEDAKFPIIGKGKDEPNDTYVEQLVADAEAAIRYVDSLGVADKNRCAVMGHSYGAFMTANLLCHSNLFAAGIARSGAYNRTLTPFGFQSEERTFWQAPGIYSKMSPFTYADKFQNPILLIHGDADNNPGTFTLQSERLFQAIKGNGGKARLVLLPFESHGYAARENIMHMLWEMDAWLDKWVNNKK